MLLALTEPQCVNPGRHQSGLHAPDTMSLIQRLVRDHKDLKAHYTLHSTERIVHCMEENPDNEDIVKVWKGYTTEDAIVAIEKVVKVIKSETINSFWRKLCPDAVHDFVGLMGEPIKEIMKLHFPDD